MHRVFVGAAAFALVFTAASAGAQQYDVIIRHAMIYDGTGGAPAQGDIGDYVDMLAEHSAVWASSRR